MQRDVKDFLKCFGLQGPNFDDTPMRVKTMWQEFFSLQKPKMTTFPLTSRPGMVVLKNFIDFGFCPHHLLSVEYDFKIGYIPEDKILGASKPLRVASYMLRQLPVQEDLGEMICSMIIQAIHPKGIGIIIKGKHNCMRIRGIKSPCVDMTTTYMWGCFLNEQSTREEFLLL